MSAPRIALLVHSRLENDPRVSRHAYAAVRAGYRVAVLSVGVHGSATGRWGEAVDGIRVYESKIVRVTLLGKARAALQRLRSRRARAHGEEAMSPETTASTGAVAGSRSGLYQAAHDLLIIGMLIRNNVGVFRQFRGIGARVVHANDLNVLLAGYLLARTWRASLVYDSHELWTQLDEDWSPFLRRLFALFEGPLLRRADAVVTVNTPIARELAAMYAVPVPTVVMNCPELSDGMEHAETPDLATVSGGTAGHVRDRNGLSAERQNSVKTQMPQQPLAVIYQGMLNSRGRGLEGLIDAAAHVEGVHLTLRGPGSLTGPLQQRIDDLGAANVQIAPPVPMAELVNALHGFDVGVVSYLPMGKNFLLCSPNKLFEYMMAGLAVVCSDLPVLREVVVNAECGLLYEAGNVESLKATLRKLAADRGQLARYKANARRAAVERYNAAAEEGRLLEVYRTLLVNRPREHPYEAR